MCIRDRYWRITAGLAIPTASKMPVSRFRLRIDMERIRIISTMLTAVMTMIRVVIRVPVSESALEIF